MRKILTLLFFSVMIHGLVFSQLEIQNGSFEDPDDEVKYTADGSGGGGPTKMDDLLTGWWGEPGATDCGREGVRTEGTVPDGRYVGFAFNNDAGSIWNLAGTVETGMRGLDLTFYVQESWPQNVTGMSIIIKFATYEGSDPTEYELVDSLSQVWDKTDADANGFVFYEFEEELPATTEGKNLMIGFDIVTEGSDNTWVNFDNFELVVSSVVTSIENKFLVNTKVYPNPAKNYLTVETKSNELSQFSLSNITGKEVLTGFINNNEKIDVSLLNRGIYLLNIQNSLGSEVIKTVLE